MDHDIERIAEHTMAKWLANDYVSRHMKSAKVAEKLGPYITISRECGAGGTAIAKHVGEKLGWDVLDQELLDYMADEFQVSHRLLQELDETKRSWFSDTLSSWLVGNGFTQLGYVHKLGKMIMMAAHHGNFVVVGRGARFILPREHGLSVRIIAPLGFRIEEAVLHRGFSADEAKKFITKKDAAREAFVKEYYHHQSADPHMYDLVINVEKLTRADAGELIVEAANAWMKKNGIEA